MIYRFKIWFEDLEDIIRLIDVKPGNTFLEFHHTIQESIGFDKKEPSSFYLSDDKWRKKLEIVLDDMGMEEEDHAEPKLLMKDCKLKDFINDPHQRFIYVTDFIAMWTLNIELLLIADEEKGKSYPLLYRSEGKAPKQREADNRFKLVDDNEFEELAAKILATKGAADLTAEINGEVEEEEEDEEKDEFGFDEFGEDESNLDGFHEETPM